MRLASLARPLSVAALVLGLLSVPAPAAAYVGPGAALAVIGAGLAVIGAFFVTIGGFVWYPVKRLVRALRGSGEGEEEARDDQAPGAKEP